MSGTPSVFEAHEKKTGCEGFSAAPPTDTFALDITGRIKSQIAECVRVMSATAGQVVDGFGEEKLTERGEAREKMLSLLSIVIPQGNHIVFFTKET
jgi:hypothetical protein